MDPKKRKVAMASLDPHVFGVHEGKCFREILFRMIAELFSCGQRGSWFRILPVDGEDDDICACLGISWKYICPVLNYMGLIGCYKTSVVKDSFVIDSQWIEMIHAVKKYHVKMYLTCVRSRGKNRRRVHYFSIDHPKYKNPFLQEKAGGAELVWRQRSSRLRKLIVDVQEAGEKILDKRNYSRSMHEEERSSARRRPRNEEDDAVVINTVSKQMNSAIDAAHNLDLDVRPRLSRKDASKIHVHNFVQADERARSAAVHYALLWGWHDSYNTVSRRAYIAEAACKMVAYDMGFQRKLASTQLPIWYAKIYRAMLTGEDADDPISPSYCGKKTYLDEIDKNCEGYMHELFRYAQSVLGPLASFEEISQLINEKSASPGETRPTLSVSKDQLTNWFKKQGGKTKSSIEKPLLTDEHKQERLVWAR